MGFKTYDDERIVMADAKTMSMGDIVAFDKDKEDKDKYKEDVLSELVAPKIEY